MKSLTFFRECLDFEVPEEFFLKRFEKNPPIGGGGTKTFGSTSRPLTIFGFGAHTKWGGGFRFNITTRIFTVTPPSGGNGRGCASHAIGRPKSVSTKDPGGWRRFPPNGGWSTSFGSPITNFGRTSFSRSHGKPTITRVGRGWSSPPGTIFHNSPPRNGRWRALLQGGTPMCEVERQFQKVSS